MEYVVVERTYDTPITDEALAELSRRVSPCLALRGVSHRATYLSKDRKRAICTYHAVDAASVQAANDEAGVAYVRVWSASLLETSPA